VRRLKIVNEVPNPDMDFNKETYEIMHVMKILYVKDRIKQITKKIRE